MLVFFPKNAVKCPLETSAKDGLARRLSPRYCMPIEDITAKSREREVQREKEGASFFVSISLSKVDYL